MLKRRDVILSEAKNLLKINKRDSSACGLRMTNL